MEMDEFDIEIFTNMLRRRFSKYLSEKTIQELEERWNMDEMDRAFSTASSMCKTIPDRFKTKEFYKGIDIIKEITFCKPKRSRVRSPSNERRIDGPSPGINKKGPINGVESYMTELKEDNHKLNDENINLTDRLGTLEYYVKVLARGVCEQNMDDIYSIQHQRSNLPIYETLHAMANTVEKMITRKHEDEWYEEYAKYKDKFLTLHGENQTLGKLIKTKCYELENCQEEMSRLEEIESRYSSLRLSHISKAETIERLEKEKKNDVERLLQCAYKIRELKDEVKRITTSKDEALGLQEQLEEKSRYCDILLKKNTNLSRCVDELKAANEGYIVTIFDFKRVVRLLQKQTDEANEGLYQGNQTHESDDSKIKDLRERVSNLQHQIDRKTTQVQNATKRADKADMTNEELEEKNIQLQKECSLKTEEIEEMRSEITKKETAIQKLQRNLNDQPSVSRKSNELESTVKMLKHEISKADQRNNETKKELEHLKQELQDVRADIPEKEKHIQYPCQRLNDEASTFRKRNESHDAYDITLQQEKSDSVERNAQLQSMLERRNQELQTLRSDLEISDKKNNSAKERNSQLQTQFEHQKQELVQVQTEITEKVKTIQDLRKMLDDETLISKKRKESEASVIRLQREISESDNRNKRLERQYEHQEIKLKQLQLEIDNKEKDIHDLRKKNDDEANVSRKRDGLETSMRRLHNELSNSDKMLDERASSSRKRYESNEVNFVKLQQEKSDTDKRYNMLQTQHEHMKRNLQQVRSEKDEQDKKIQDLRKEYTHLEKESQQVRSEKDEQDKQIQDLRKQLDERARSTRKHESNDAKFVQLQQEKSETEERYNVLQNQQKDLKKELQQVRSKKDEQDTQIQDLRKRLDDKDSTSRKHNEYNEVTFVNLQQEKAETDKRYNVLQNQKEDLKKELQQLRSEKDEQNNYIQDLRKNIERLQRKLDQHEHTLETAQSDIQRKDTSNERLEKDANLLQTKLQRTESELQITKEKYDDIQKSNERLEKDANLLRTKLQKTESELQISKEKYYDIQKRLSNIGKNSQRLGELESMLETVKKEKHDTEESYATLRKDAEQLQEQFQRTQTEFRLAQERNEDLKNRYERLEKDANLLRTKLQGTESELRISKEKYDDIQKRVNNIGKNSQRLEELEGMLEAVKKEKHDTEESYANLKRDAERLQKQYQKTKTELRLAQEKNEDLQNRFSKVAAAQLTHDNPNIADLSDKNRPTKLAEAFSELYDNEWTEAYSAMEDDPNNTTTEEDIVKKLKNVLLTCFSKCTDISTSQIQGIKALLLSPSNVSSMTRPKHELSTEQAKAVNDLRKQTTAFAIESVKQVMAKDNAESRKYPAMKTFIEKCAELCWLMVVQSPPVFIDDRHKTNDRFDKDIFKAYTKGGHSLDYVVWPPVYLHRGGPLLCKGTAQGK